MSEPLVKDEFESLEPMPILSEDQVKRLAEQLQKSLEVYGAHAENPHANFKVYTVRLHSFYSEAEALDVAFKLDKLGFSAQVRYSPTYPPAAPTYTVYYQYAMFVG